MADLSHWIFAKDFTVYEAAFLILGVDPSKDTDAFSSRHIQERMVEAYEGALSNLRQLDECFLPDWFEERRELIEPHKTLKSIQIHELLNKYQEGDEVCISEWLLNGRNQIYGQRFSREDIGRWISKNKLPSVYRFLNETTLLPQETAELVKPLGAAEEKNTLNIVETDMDPLDLPAELDAANMAFRAVTNGYGDPLATFKNRLIGYLKKNFPDLSSDAVKRIATVANPDKTTGRKKSNTE